MDMLSLILTSDPVAPAQHKPFPLPPPPPPPAGTTTPPAGGPAPTPKPVSPNGDSKAVSFTLRDSHCEPKTFHIRPHDTTDSIMDTVKHLFGMSRQYDLGISLEDADGLSFIPSYDNFVHGMPVYVRIEDSVRGGLAYRHPYNLRQPQGMSTRASAFPTSRSVSPQTRGRRSASATGVPLNGSHGRSLKRSALCVDSDAELGMVQQDGLWHRPPLPPSLLPEDEEEPRTKAASVASADISVENIVEGSRRKRPKFSSDELPLFPPTRLLKQDGSLSSSPACRVAQLATPYSNRHFSFCHPTSPSNTEGPRVYRSNRAPTHPNRPPAVPTPAPTVTSCISDEDVAIQLMRLGNVNAGTATTASTTDDMRDGFSSDCGDYGDYDGRSDTTELPDPLPVEGLPDNPAVCPRDRNSKSLDENPPSLDTTEPSDDDSENRPPAHPFVSRPPRPCNESVIRAHRTVRHCNEETATRDDEGDKTYVAKGEGEGPGHEEDLEDVPLKMRRESKVAAAATALQAAFSPLSAPMTVRVLHSKPTQQLPRGIAKIIIRRKQPAPLQSRPHQPAVKQEPSYPISPASPPASRNPSVSASVSSGRTNNAQANSTPDAGISTPLSPDESASLAVGAEVDELRPRCQRCRKSKKGCDRQRPCRRCQDAGVPADQCVSEDEAGTRRGRQVAAAAKKAVIDTKSDESKSKPRKKRRRM